MRFLSVVMFVLTLQFAYSQKGNLLGRVAFAENKDWVAGVIISVKKGDFKKTNCF